MNPRKFHQKPENTVKKGHSHGTGYKLIEECIFGNKYKMTTAHTTGYIYIPFFKQKRFMKEPHTFWKSVKTYDFTNSYIIGHGGEKDDKHNHKRK